MPAAWHGAMGPQQPGEATPILQRGGDDGHKLEIRASRILWRLPDWSQFWKVRWTAMGVRLLISLSRPGTRHAFLWREPG